jgi:hypothetical protein
MGRVRSDHNIKHDYIKQSPLYMYILFFCKYFPSLNKSYFSVNLFQVRVNKFPSYFAINIFQVRNSPSWSGGGLHKIKQAPAETRVDPSSMTTLHSASALRTNSIKRLKIFNNRIDQKLIENILTEK